MINFVELPSTGLLMAKTPITQAQWREVMGTDPSYFMVFFITVYMLGAMGR